MKNKRIALLIIHACVFIIARSQTPGLLWEKKYGTSTTTLNHEALDITTDPHLRLYSTGYYNGAQIMLDSILLGNTTTAGQNHMFVMKSDSSGNAIWARQTKGPGRSKGFAVETDDSGFVYVLGEWFQDSISWGSYSLSSPHGIFLVKLDSMGNTLWLRWGTPDIRYNNYPDLDISSQNNNIVITGNFINSATFSSTVITSAGGYDIFAAEYDRNGILLWANRYGGPADDAANAVHYDRSGNILLAGYFNTSITFNNTIIAGNSQDTYLAKLSSNGTPMYVVNDYSAETWDVNVDLNNNYYLTGRYNNLSGYITKYTAAGVPVWSKYFTPSANFPVYSYDIDLDLNCNLLVAGWYFDQVTIGTYTMGGNGGYYEGYVTKIDTSGNVLWAVTISGGGTDGCYAVSGIGNSIYAAGTLTRIPNTSYNDYMITKLFDYTFVGKNELPVPAGGVNVFYEPGSFHVIADEKKDQKRKLSVYSILGHLVFQASFENSIVVPAELWKDGIYLFVIDESGKASCFKRLKY